MGYEIFIVGEEIDISKYNTENFILDGNKCIVTFDTREMAISTVNDINKEGRNKAFLYGEVKKVLDQPITEYIPLEDIQYKEIMEFQFNKEEEFVVLNDGALSIWKVKNEDVESESRNQMYGNIMISNTGNFLVNYFNNRLNCFTKDFTRLFNDFYFESLIQKIEFSRNDTFLSISTLRKIYIIDFYKGKVLLEKDIENVKFDLEEKLIYFLDTKQCFNLINGESSTFSLDLKIIKSLENQCFYFYEGKVQRIIYSNGKHNIKKNQVNIEKVNFGFTNNTGYAYIIKKIKDLFLYTLEIFVNEMIFLINFENEPKDYKVSDKMVIAFDTERNLIFYKRSGKSFGKFKEINKDGEVLISLSDQNACIYDETSENLEFYDKGELRSVYLHRACTGLHWSKSGLYLAAISSNSGVLQLFNNNGKLIFKKVYNVFTKFLWRPFIKLSDEDKQKIDNYDISKYIGELSVSAASEYNLETLISNWKSFLVGKRQLLNK